MIINITDIPNEGRELEFPLDEVPLNARIVEALDRQLGEVNAHTPAYVFEHAPIAKLRLELEGRTVLVTGSAQGKVRTCCARCAEEASQSVDVAIQLVLKPLSTTARRADDFEDMHFGFYDGKEIDCGSIVEEFLVLSLPYTVLCKESCKGLCQNCGANLNAGPCGCRRELGSDERLAVLKSLKIQ